MTWINHEIHFAWQGQSLLKVACEFSWQAQYLVKLDGDFSWQAHHVVKFCEIAGVRNVVFFNAKCVSKMRRVMSPKCEMTILSSDYPWIMLD